ERRLLGLPITQLPEAVRQAQIVGRRGKGGIDPFSAESLYRFQIPVAKLFRRFDNGPFAPVVPGGDLHQRGTAFQGPLERHSKCMASVVGNPSITLVYLGLAVDVV